VHTTEKGAKTPREESRYIGYRDVFFPKPLLDPPHHRERTRLSFLSSPPPLPPSLPPFLPPSLPSPPKAPVIKYDEKSDSRQLCPPSAGSGVEDKAALSKAKAEAEEEEEEEGSTPRGRVEEEERGALWRVGEWRGDESEDKCVLLLLLLLLLVLLLSIIANVLIPPLRGSLSIFLPPSFPPFLLLALPCLPHRRCRRLGIMCLH